MKALFVVDVQEEYMSMYNDRGLLDLINQKIMRCSENNDLIIYVKNVRNLKSGPVSYEFAQGLRVCSDNIIFKNKASVFADTGLLEKLQLFEVNRIEIIGIDGNCCVASSAFDAREKGFDVTVDSRFIGVLNKERWEKRKEQLRKKGIEII